MMSPEERAAHLERIREAIAHDAYDVPARAVADAIVDFYARPSDSGAGGGASA
jgi:anti-sigma28 factor (negative regulator of flagellin synthesis)